jgi:hypothetical protein
MNLSTEQVIELVKQLPASGKYQILLSLRDELETVLSSVEQIDGEGSTLEGLLRSCTMGDCAQHNRPWCRF